MSLRLLHVLPSLDEAHGGPLRLVLDLSVRAAELGLVSEVVATGPVNVRDNPLPPEAIHAFSGGPASGWAYSPEMRRWLRDNVRRFDGVVIHGAWLYPGWAAAAECRHARVPYAYYPHGMLEKWAITGQGKLKEWKKRAYWTLFESRIANGACRILFTTRREEELTLATFPVQSAPGLLAPYGIESQSPVVASPATPAIAQPAGAKIALFLGRLHPKKNPELLLAAWKKAGELKGWRLVFAGSGAPGYQESLEALVQELGIDSSVQFTGFVAGRDKLYLLQRAAWFLLPSSQENFGIAVLEAVAQRCAVALSDQVYLTESFPPESEILPVAVEPWAKFLKERLDDEMWRKQVQRGNYAHLMKHFGMDAVVAHWHNTFKSLFARREPPRP